MTSARDATICLCMMVRNESRVIARALASVRPVIDYWIVCDTGSTDSTPGDVARALEGIPGELHHVPWVDFGHNREITLRLAAEKADYLLIMDADMVANVRGPFKRRLTADWYEIRYEGGVDYTQAMLLANRHAWRYSGVTHEYVHAETARTSEVLNELTYTHFGDGANRADKFERDIMLLSAELERDPANPRTVFYLAQSHKDLGHAAEALALYERRAALHGWDEERWYALYMAAHMKQLLGEDEPAVRSAYLTAFATRPWRLEPLYHAVKALRERGAYELAFVLAASVAAGARYPGADQLFIERAVYEFSFRLEYGVCAFGTGRFSEAVEAFDAVLMARSQPQWVVESALRGRSAALQYLFPMLPAGRTEPHALVVIVPFHNPGSSLERCVRSVLEQDDPNFRVIFCDDGSSDGSQARLPHADPRVRVLRNAVRRGLAPNLHALILEHCAPDEIVVCLDGDDWLSCSDALSSVRRLYERHDCWVSYGQFEYAGGARGFCRPFASARDFATLRGNDWRTSHLRTFRAGLFHRIAEQDPEYACLRDGDGAWLRSSEDAALMFPLLELAGFERVRFNEKVLYVYNDRNPLSGHNADRELQAQSYAAIVRKRPFARVDDYRPRGAAALARATAAHA